MLEDCGWDVDQAINDLKEEELGRCDILRRLQEQLARSRVVSGRLAEVVRSPMIFTHGWSCRCWKIQTLFNKSIEWQIDPLCSRYRFGRHSVGMWESPENKKGNASVY